MDLRGRVLLSIRLLAPQVPNTSQFSSAIPRPTLDRLITFQHLSDFHRVAIHHCGHDCPNGHAILLHRVRLSIVAEGQDQHVAISVDACCFDCREVWVRLKARSDSSAVIPDSYRVCPLEHGWLGHLDDPHAQERLGIRRGQQRTLSARSGGCDGSNAATRSARLNVPMYDSSSRRLGSRRTSRELDTGFFDSALGFRSNSNESRACGEVTRSSVDVPDFHQLEPHRPMAQTR